MPRLCGRVEDLGLESVEGRAGAEGNFRGAGLSERECDAAAHAFGGTGDKDRVRRMGFVRLERVDKRVGVVVNRVGEVGSCDYDGTRRVR